MFALDDFERPVRDLVNEIVSGGMKGLIFRCYNFF